MIRLAQPEWLVLAAVAVGCAVLWGVRRRNQRYPVAVPTRAGASWWIGWVSGAPGVLAALALVAVSVALARPQEVLARRLVRSRGVDIAVALDVSGSMAALDFKPGNRLAVAKRVIRDFLRQRPTDRIALVAFAGAAVTVCPLTLDHEVAGALLDRLEIGALPDGTAIGMGLGVAVNRLRRSDAVSKVIVLVTDGANNAGELDPRTAAELAAREGVVVHTVLVGRGGVVPIPVKMRDPFTGRVRKVVRRLRVETNPKLLEQIAQRTGGTSFSAEDPQGLQRAFHEIDRMERTQFTSSRLVRTRERFAPWALLAAALLLAAVGTEAAVGRTPW